MPNMPQFNTLIYLGVLLLCGLAFGRLAKLVKLPNVTGYIVSGLILGPCVLNFIPKSTVDSYSAVSEVALSFIAFTIGSGFKLSYFKKVGSSPVVIAIFEAMAAVFLVQICLVMFGFDPAFSIVLGAIAAATAPAATFMVIKQYNAKGPVTDTLMSVVAIDDAVALIAFAFCVTIAKAMNGDSDSLLISILKPFVEVFGALVLGALLGYLMKFPLKFFKKRSNRTIIMCGFVLLCSGIATFLGLSSLLACMMFGCMFCNVSHETDSILKLADNITPPIFLLFFTLSGAQLDLKILPTVGLVGVIYITVRVLGKLGGASLGAKLTKASPTVSKYLGLTLVPQAGVAIGLTIVAQSAVPQYANEIRAVVLCGTLVYELIGPVLTKTALTKAGEITKS